MRQEKLSQLKVYSWTVFYTSIFKKLITEIRYSCLPWFEIFYKFLDRLSDHLNSNDDKSISLLSKLYEIESFEAGESVLLSSLETNEVRRSKFSFNAK